MSMKEIENINEHKGILSQWFGRRNVEKISMLFTSDKIPTNVLM